MPVDHREIAFENAIEECLLGKAGYERGDRNSFDRERCLDPTVLMGFLQET